MPSFVSDPRRNLIRRGLFQLHLWVGLALALYFALVCITGAILVYKVEMEQALHGGLPKVPPGTARQSWQSLLQSVREAYPRARITTLYFPESETDAPYFRLVTGVGRFDGRTYVFINPYTGAIVGEDIAQNSFLAFVYDLHSNLLAAKTGLFLNGVGGFLLAGMMISGLVVWWPGSRVWRSGFRYESRARWKRKNYDLHKLGGLIAALPMLLIAFTGSYYAFPAQYKAIASSDGHWFQTPSVSGGEKLLPLDALIDRGRAELPAAELGMFRFPAKPDDSVSLRLRFVGDWSRFGNQIVHLNPATGAVLRKDIHATRPVAVRLIDQIGALHFGTFGGHPMRVLWMLFGLLGLGLPITGILMWWNRVLSKQRWFRRRVTPAPRQPDHVSASNAAPESRLRA